MLSAQRHRGPDDRGVVVLRGRSGEELGALGNVRLAILDPSPAGHQPMEEAGRALVLNGELYDHLEVRRALGTERSWRSGADTETLLAAHATWGRECLTRLRGMFAFALWDPAIGELWCARDRVGIKPLYYAVTAEAFVFASEVRGILSSGLLSTDARLLDPQGLASYVRFGAVSEPRTLMRGVRSLPAGVWIRVASGEIVEQRVYWSPQATSPAQRRCGSSYAIVRAELERAVQEHLLSDVPVASLLSGGLDSGVVTALASRHAPGRLRTFTLGWDDPALDESRSAEAIARACGTDHTTVRLTDGEVARLVPRAVAAMDLPTSEGINTYLVSSVVAAAGLKVVLSGLGGDELFGGYPSFRRVPQAARLAPWLGRFPGLVNLIAGGGNRGARAAALLARELSLAERYEAMRALWSDPELAELGVARAPPLAAWPVGAALGGVAISLLELSGYMRSTLLRDSDAMSMAHSLELRVPLLDHTLLEVCLATRAAEGLGDRRPKAVLRRLASELLPGGPTKGPKRGFMLPMERWMRGPLARFVEDGLEALRAAGAPLRIDGVRAGFDAGRLSWARLWQFVVLGHWLDGQRGILV